MQRYVTDLRLSSLGISAFLFSAGCEMSLLFEPRSDHMNERWLEVRVCFNEE